MSKAEAYDIFALTLLNVVDKLVPRLLIAVIAATAIKAAIRPYSIAVAPSSFLKIFLITFMFGLQFYLFIHPGGFFNNNRRQFDTSLIFTKSLI